MMLLYTSPGVLECDIKMYSRTPGLLSKSNMRAVLWYFKGPSKTKFKFETLYLF